MPRLREFAAEEYHRRRRHDDAMTLMWAEFSERPFLETYKTLEKHAKKAGTGQWRGRALGEIRLRIAKAKEKARGQARPRWLQAADNHSVLVEIFLYEGKAENAWREAGVEEGRTAMVPSCSTGRRNTPRTPHPSI